MKIFIKWTSLIGTVVVLGFLLIRSLTVRQVRCFLNDQAITVETVVCQQLQQLIGAPLIFRDFQHDPSAAGLLYVEASKEAFDLVRVEKSLIGEVDFYLSDQPPLYRLEQNQTTHMVTASGFLRENNPQLKVPLVLDPQQVYQDQPERSHSFLARFLEQLPLERERLQQIRLVSSQRIELEVVEFPLVIVELSQEPQQVARRLRLILEKLEPNQIDVALQEIDLRFELPALRTYQSSDSTQVLIDIEQ